MVRTKVPTNVGEIKDGKMRSAYKKYIGKFYTNYISCNRASNNTLLHMIKDIRLSDLNWETIIQISSMKLTSITDRGSRIPTIFRFVYFLIENNLYFGDYKKEFMNNKKDFYYYVTSGYINKETILKQKGITPLSIIVFPSHNGNATGVITYPYPTNEMMEILRLYFVDDTDDTNKRKKYVEDARIFTYFVKSLEGKYKVDNINDLCDQTFFQQIKYFHENSRDDLLAHLVKFYIYIIKNMDKNIAETRFKVINLTLLKHNNIISYLTENFQIVKYSIYNEPPDYDKMILCENNMDTNSTVPKDKIVIFRNDFVKNKRLRKWYTDYFWNSNEVSFFYRPKHYSPIRDFLKLLDGNLTKFDIEIEISVVIVMVYKATLLEENSSDSTKGKKLGTIKKFINFLDLNKHLVVNPIIYSLFAHKENKKNDNKEAYSKEQIDELLGLFKNKFENEKTASKKLLYELHYCALKIMAITEIRMSSIFAITTDSIVKTLCRKGGDEYKLLVQSKGTGGNLDEYNITRRVKEIIDHVRNITSEVRCLADYLEKDYLFIYIRKDREVISIVRQDTFTGALKSMCQKNNIKYLDTSGIRNYYMQNVSDLVSKKNFDPSLYVPVLGGHTLAVHVSSYDKPDLRDFCSLFYEVEIGSILIKGKVEKFNELPETSQVEKGCGKCPLNKCLLLGKLDCFMCSQFVTTLECIPFFDKEIEAINCKIINTPLQHEKEFLISKKKLMVAYVSELMMLKSEVEGNDKFGS